jgi:Kef-type K+ transport system membrane component KefB
VITVDSESFLAIVAAAAIAALVGGLAGRRVLVPVVAVEIVLGILIGPQVLGLADPDEFLDFFASLGLGMLFFFAGYEIDFERIRGSPLRLAALGWLLSLALAYALGRSARSGRSRRVARLHGIRHGDDGDRHARPDPQGRG